MHRRAPSSKIRHFIRCHTCRPCPRNQLQNHRHNHFGAHEHNKIWKLASADLVRPMAIGNPITLAYGNKCTGVDPHQCTPPDLPNRYFCHWQRFFVTPMASSRNEITVHTCIRTHLMVFRRRRVGQCHRNCYCYRNAVRYVTLVRTE